MDYPILFSFNDLLAGRGFFALVETSGRALLCESDEGAWLHGVAPGGIAAGGAQRADAFLAFKNEYQAVLFDIADSAASFGEFKAEIERFIHETSRPTEAAWNAALEAVRSGAVSREQGLRVESANERPPGVKVTLVKEAEPGVNTLDTDFAEAA